MSRAVITKSLLSAIANAIRAKTGGSGSMTPAQMATAISNLPDATTLLKQWLEDSVPSTGIVTNATKIKDYGGYKSGRGDHYLSITAENLTDVGSHAFDNAYLGDCVLSGPNGAGAALAAWVFYQAKIYGAVDIVIASYDASSGTTFNGLNIQNTGSLRLTLTGNEFPKSCAKSELVAFSQTSKPAHVVGKQVIFAPNATWINKQAMEDCAQLTALDIPYITGTSMMACKNCSGLTSINAPVLETVGEQAFSGCTGLTEVDLPAGATIESSAFYGCTSLEKIRIGVRPDIKASAFSGCAALDTFVLDLPSGASLPNLRNTSAFSNTPIASGTGYIYINDDMVDSLKAASNWSTYAAQIKPLSDLPTA